MIIPYIEKIKEDATCALMQRALCIFDDVGKLYETNSRKKYLAINPPFKKQHMKAHFENFYANNDANQLKRGLKTL